MPALLNPCELEIDLFCKGLRIDPSCRLERDGRAVARTRAGLGSGLELVLPGSLKDVWVNVPVEEDFAAASPYWLVKNGDEYWIHDERDLRTYRVRVPPEPAWYSRRTRAGTPMRRVGVLQGTYLGIYISNACLYWYSDPPLHCRFCATGANVGVNEVALKSVEDVVEVCRAAKEESGVTFVHLNRPPFRPREGQERLSTFFYKRSNLTWSRDRFSYGAVEFRPEQLTRDEATAWLAWLVSGFDPAAKPERLRRAFLYDVPD